MQGYVYQAIMVFIILNIILIAVLSIIKVILRIIKRNLSVIKIWKYSLIFTYILALFSMTMVYWDFLIDADGIEFWINCPKNKRINLIPFKTLFAYVFIENSYVDSWEIVSFSNVIGNVFLFTPIGYMITYFYNKKIKSTMFIGAGISICIEFVQYFTGRVSDIDDFTLNMIGLYIGVLLGNYVKGYIKSS